MDIEKIYCAKLMLAGEYGVISGGEAITVPLDLYSAKLAERIEGEDEDTINASVSSLRKLLSYIQSLPKNSFFAYPQVREMNDLLKKGFYIKSSIPMGYGIGSSGTVCALIYDQFFSGTKNLSLQQQRKDLATMESLFHGKSSGVDAMTSFTGNALHFLGDGAIRPVERDPLKPMGKYRFFLLDSETVFDTGPLVKTFLNKMEDHSFKKAIKEDYLPMISKFIESLTGERNVDPGLLFRAISDFQCNNFREMIPQKMEDAWIDGQVSNTYYLKLNGSGGGFMLGIAAEESMELCENMLDEYKIIWL